VFKEYERAWAPVFELKMEYVRSEMNSQFANIATPSEIVVSTMFSLELGGAQADMHICFPYSMLEPIRETLYSTMQSDSVTQDRRWIGTMTKQIKTATVELTASLGEATVTLRDIVNMRVGDVIPLNIPERIKGQVDGVTVLEGQYGVQNGQYALRVDRMIPPEDSDDPPETGEHNG